MHTPITDKIMEAVVGFNEWAQKNKEKFMKKYNPDHDCHASPEDGCQCKPKESIEEQMDDDSDEYREKENRIEEENRQRAEDSFLGNF